MFERWLAARDAASIRSAWTALAPRRHEVGQPGRKLSFHGAAQLAAALLGERHDWIVDLARRPPAVRTDGVVDDCFLDDAWDVRQLVHEHWELHEQRSERGGVQVVSVGLSSVGGQPDGSGEAVVRIFDRNRAASVRIGTNKVSTIGDIDLAPLDLFEVSASFGITARPNEADTLRALVAELGVVEDAEGSTTVERPYSQTTATVHGLPWGHSIVAWISSQQEGRTRGSLYVRLPDADIARLLARLAALP